MSELNGKSMGFMRIFTCIYCMSAWVEETFIQKQCMYIHYVHPLTHFFFLSEHEKVVHSNSSGFSCKIQDDQVGLCEHVWMNVCIIFYDEENSVKWTNILSFSQVTFFSGSAAVLKQTIIKAWHWHGIIIYKMT